MEKITLDELKHSPKRFKCNPNEIIWGNVGSGKTTKMKEEIQKAASWVDYVFVLDRYGEYKNPSWNVVDVLDQELNWKPGVNVCSFHPYPQKETPALARTVLEKVKQRMFANPMESTALYIDGTADLLDDEGWRELYYRTIKRIRKYSGFVCFTLQEAYPPAIRAARWINFHNFFRLTRSQAEEMIEEGILPGFALEQVISLPWGTCWSYERGMRAIQSADD